MYPSSSSQVSHLPSEISLDSRARSYPEIIAPSQSIYSSLVKFREMFSKKPRKPNPRLKLRPWSFWGYLILVSVLLLLMCPISPHASFVPKNQQLAELDLFSEFGQKINLDASPSNLVSSTNLSHAPANITSVSSTSEEESELTPSREVTALSIKPDFKPDHVRSRPIKPDFRELDDLDYENGSSDEESKEVIPQWTNRTMNMIEDDEDEDEGFSNYMVEQSKGKGSTRRGRRSVVHLYDMVVCSTRCNPIAYKGYGCYCGFLGSGLTVDGIDKCCAKHDFCYQVAKCPPLLTYFVPYYWTCQGGRPQCMTDFQRGWKGICGNHLCECDRKFAECLKRYPCPSKRAMCMTSPFRNGGALVRPPRTMMRGALHFPPPPRPMMDFFEEEAFEFDNYL